MRASIMGVSVESIVTSLDYSMQLKALGIKQDSLFYWAEIENYYIEQPRPVITNEIVYAKDGDVPDGWICSAFTASELGNFFNEEMSSGIDSDGEFYCTALLKDDNNVTCYAENETDARAKMLIFLIEQGIIKI